MSTPSIEFHLEPSAAQLAPARGRLRHWLDGSGVDEAIAEELLVVAAELWSNAAEATPGATDPVHFVARNDGSSVHFEVSNRARPNDRWTGERARVEDPLRDRGRGLDIVDALTDAMVVNSFDGRTVVRCMRTLDPPA